MMSEWGIEAVNVSTELWESEVLPSARVEIARHPQFAIAANRFATNMLQLCEEDARLCAVFKDAGRYVAAMAAVHIHSGGGALTVNRLKQICAATGFLSVGRAKAIIEFLIHLEFLELEHGVPGPVRY